MVTRTVGLPHPVQDSICKTVTPLALTKLTTRSGEISQFIIILSARNAAPKFSVLLTANVLNCET